MLKLFTIFFISVTIYGCSTDFNHPQNDSVTKKVATISNIPVKFINSSGKVAFEIIENGSNPIPENKNNLQSGKLSEQDIKSLKGILKDIEMATQQEKKSKIKPSMRFQPKSDSFPDRINYTLQGFSEGVNNYVKLMYKAD